MRKLVIAVACLAAVAAPARADVARLSATYDFMQSNTFFTISNVSGVSEALTLTTSFGPITTVTLANLAAGATTTYGFNQINGGYVTDPQGAGIPDTTTYTLLVGLNNGPTTLSSGSFSPLSNLTGGDVDFLGTQCQGFAAGCPSNVALSGLVAVVPSPATAVPEPVSASLLAAGLGALGLVRRRRA